MNDKIKVLMLCDIDRGHQTRPSLPIFEKMFSDAGFEFRFSEDRNDLRRAALEKVNVLVCYTTGGELTPEQGDDGVVNLVAGGVGFVGIHSAADSFHNCRRYERMVGGVFLNHPPIQDYTFKVLNHNHPVMAGIDDFIAPEELYLMETSGHFEVVLSTTWDGFERPAAWVKPYGFGRVFYTALGHSKTQHEGAMFQRMIVNAIRWAAARRGWPKELRGEAPPPFPGAITSWQVSRLMPKGAGIAGAACVALSDNVEWKHFACRGPFVDVHTGLFGDKDGLVYLSNRFTVAKAGEWDFLLGHDGGVRAFVDGRGILTTPELKNPASKDRSRARVKLAAGEHEVVIALDLAAGCGWGIFFRWAVPDEKREPGTEAVLPELVER